MFSRLGKQIGRVLPILALAPFLYNPKIALAEDNIHRELGDPASIFPLQSQNSKIRFFNDINAYIESRDRKRVSVILFYEMKGDAFIDGQVYELVNQFLNKDGKKISEDYEFVFLQPPFNFEPSENFLIVFSQKGQKFISLDPYLNKNKHSPHIKLNPNRFNNRLLDTIGRFKEVGLESIAEELENLELSRQSNFLIAFTDKQEKITKAKDSLSGFLKQFEINTNNFSKFVIKDQATKTILGLSKGSPNKPYLLTPKTINLRKEFVESTDFFTINGKKYTLIEADQDLSKIFVFPPIARRRNPEELVLNVYLNKNKDIYFLQKKIYQQLSKPDYASLIKAVHFTSEVQTARLTLELNDSVKLALKAFEENTTLTKQEVRKMLFNTSQWVFPIKNAEDVDTKDIKEWLERVQGPNKQSLQFYKSQPYLNIWATQIVGQEYRKIRDLPFDKVIYHYSKHCAGCSKFGWKFELFAQDENKKYSGINFYRIDNDLNKVKDVRNFNSTPVFVFYKKGERCPFIYKMPYFTNELFDSFLTITKELRIIKISDFEKQIENHKRGEVLVREFLA